LLQPDHATPSKIKTHSSEAVPFAIISNRTFGNVGAKARRYTEADSKATGTTLTDGYRLIETLLDRGGAIEAH
jgi:2,3-bisphosphoglycerate-independent phosphoglycerate mutase